MQMAVSDFVEQVDTTFAQTISLQQGAHDTLYTDSFRAMSEGRCR